MEDQMKRFDARREWQRQGAQGRASRNMRALQRMSRKETYVRGIGQGIIFLFIGCVVLGLNMQKVGNPSLLVDVQAIPAWAQVLGGCSASFGLCWAIRDASLLVMLTRSSKQMSDKATHTDPVG